jgi:alkylated DNA repair dioxygenase AlkB
VRSRAADGGFDAEERMAAQRICAALELDPPNSTSPTRGESRKGRGLRVLYILDRPCRRRPVIRGQASLFAPEPDLPQGMRLRAELVSPEEEAALVERFAELPFEPFQFRGYEGRRRIVSFGWRYDFSHQRLGTAEPLPDFLLPLRDRAAAFLGVSPGRLEHALITEYAPGAAIGWHKDRPEFGEVVGVSFGAPCSFRLRRRAGAGWERRSFTAEPRAAYTLQGPARTDWEHSIPAVEALRYSVTFRALRR